MFKKFKLRLKAYFLTGLFVLVPLVVSVKVFLWFLTFVDDLLKPVLEDIFGRYFFGVGIVLCVAVTFVVGIIAQNYLGKRLVGVVDAIFNRLPFIRTIHSVVRQLIEPFSSESGRSFRQVVLVEYPLERRFSLGFVANEHVGTKDGENLVTVFIPSNHLHLGYLVVMPEKDVIPLDLSVEEALKIIVSCGIVVTSTFEIAGTKLVRSTPAVNTEDIAGKEA